MATLKTTDKMEIQTAFNEGFTLLKKCGFGVMDNDKNKITFDACKLAEMIFNGSSEKFWKEFKQSVNNQL
jgi:hypothetical protein